MATLATRTKTYKASGAKQPCIRVEPNSRVISLEIIKVDEIVKLGPINCFGGPDNDFIKNHTKRFTWHEETHQRVVQGISDAYPFKPNQSSSEAFWKTLIGDVTFANRPAPAILGFEYNAWVKNENILKSYLSLYPSTLAFDQGALDPRSGSVLNWWLAMAQCAVGRRLYITKKG